MRHFLLPVILFALLLSSCRQADSGSRTRQYLLEAAALAEALPSATTGFTAATQARDYAAFAKILDSLQDTQTKLGTLNPNDVDPLALQAINEMIQTIGEIRTTVVETEGALRSAEVVAARRSTPGLIKTVISAFIRGAVGDPFGEASDSDSEERALRQRVNRVIDQRQTMNRSNAHCQTVWAQLLPTLKQKYPKEDWH